MADAPNIAVNLKSYLAGFSENARKISDNFRFNEHINRLDRAGILYLTGLYSSSVASSGSTNPVSNAMRVSSWRLATPSLLKM